MQGVIIRWTLNCYEPSILACRNGSHKWTRRLSEALVKEGGENEKDEEEDQEDRENEEEEEEKDQKDEEDEEAYEAGWLAGQNGGRS